MITIRNKEDAHSRTVLAGEALRVGMLVKLVQGASAGDPCSVVKASAADRDNPNLLLGIVDYHVDDEYAVDFVHNPLDQSDAVNEGPDGTINIPAGAPCVIWYGAPVVGFHISSVGEDLAGDFNTIREGALMDFDDASLLAEYDSDGDGFAKGTLYQHEGAELTVIFHKL